MCPAGETDPQDRGRAGWAVLAGVVVFAGSFIVWARAFLPRPSDTPSEGGQVFRFDLALT